MTIHVFGGGSVQYVRGHMALSAPAYGGTARYLFGELGPEMARLHLTKMADSSSTMETNEEVGERLLQVLSDPATRVIVFSVALCDFAGQIGDIPSGKYAKRLSSREGDEAMQLTPTPKLLKQVKALRPDVRLVGFKTTTGELPREQHRLALRQIQETGADLVFANDTKTRNNLLVTSTGIVEGTRKALAAELLKVLKGWAQ